ncbi:hypothetical protein BDAP_000343 [Binucleata daphniae]
MISYALQCIKTESSISSYYIQKNNTKLLITLYLQEKSEIDDKVEVLIVCDDDKIISKYQKIIFEITNNLLSGSMEKTKLRIVINIVDFDDNLFATMLDCLCICLIESGIEMYDIFGAFSNNNISMVYSTNQNNVMYCAWSGTNNYHDDLNLAIEKCVENSENIKEYVINKYT